MTIVVGAAVGLASEPSFGLVSDPHATGTAVVPNAVRMLRMCLIEVNHSARVYVPAPPRVTGERRVTRRRLTTSLAEWRRA